MVEPVASNLWNPQLALQGLAANGIQLTQAESERLNALANDVLNDYDPRNGPLGPNPVATAQRYTYKTLRFASGQGSGPSLGDAFSKLFSGDFSGFFEAISNWWNGATADADQATPIDSIDRAMGKLSMDLKRSGGNLAAAADLITGNSLGGTATQSWSLREQALANLNISEEAKARGSAIRPSEAPHVDLPTTRYAAADVQDISAPAATPPGTPSTAALTPSA